MAADVIRIDNEVIRFLAHIEACARDRRRLEALLVDADGIGDVRAFARQLGFAFSIEALADALEKLRATVSCAGPMPRSRSVRAESEVFRLARSMVRLRPAARTGNAARPQRPPPRSL